MEKAKATEIRDRTMSWFDGNDQLCIGSDRRRSIVGQQPPTTIFFPFLIKQFCQYHVYIRSRSAGIHRAIEFTGVKNEFNSIFFLRDSSYGGCLYCLLLCRFHAHAIGRTNLNFDPSYDVVYNSTWQLSSHETNRFRFPKTFGMGRNSQFPTHYFWKFRPGSRIQSSIPLFFKKIKTVKVKSEIPTYYLTFCTW